MAQKTSLNDYSLAFMTQRYEMSSSTFGYHMVTQYHPKATTNKGKFEVNINHSNAQNSLVNNSQSYTTEMKPSLYTFVAVNSCTS